MPVFNEVQKKRRGLITQRKRTVHVDPITGKLKQRSQSNNISANANARSSKNGAEGMPVFNEVQKKRGGLIAQRKRAVHGDTITGKLKQRSQSNTISGKCQRKIFKKWRRDQKEALGKGLITMEDVEMAVAEGTSVNTTPSKEPSQFRVNKNKKKLKIQQLKKRGKNKLKSDKHPAAEKSIDAMVE